MKAAVLKAPGVMELDDIPDPVAPKGGALLEILACAVCGTDLKMREHGHRDLDLPRVLGHEMVGRIVEMDSSLISGRRRQSTTLAGHRLRKMQALPAGSR